jgi:alpha-galactosidase
VWDWRRGILTVEKECEGLLLEGGELVLSLRILHGSESEVFDHYFSHFDGAVDPEPRSGWSSWYRYYHEVDEGAVRSNLEAYRSRGIPLDIFQIDDGWQRSVGDWLEVDESFPSGMAALASEIRSAGYTPGLWIAPFVAEESSQLFREHPDWFIKDATGDPLVAGYNPFHWTGRFYALDPLFPQVYEYLRRVFATVFEEWGFGFVKLDYLFAAAMLPREGKSRGRIMFEALRMLREFTGERMSLGCGVPLGSAFGFLDYCRVGADTAPCWEDGKLVWAGYRERTSTRNALRSTIGRRQLSGRAFGNDPDVFILREHDQKMTVQQRRTLFLVNLVYGRLHFSSDNPAEYDEQAWKLYLSQFPLRRTGILEADESHAVFRAAGRRYLFYHNLERTRREVEVPEGLYYGFGEGFFSGGALQLEPYESRLYLAVDPKPYAVAGSTGLALPGSEVEDFRFDEGRIDFRVSSGVMQEGSIFLKVPTFLEQCTVNGISYPCEEKVDMNLVVIPRR